MFVTTLALLALHPPAIDEFTEQLARLAAPQAAVRAAAERWLQAHVVFERYPDVAESALAGDAEVRGRLARVLSSDARHLTLALALAVENDAALSWLGRDAVRASVARSDPRLGEPAVRDGLELLLRRAAGSSPPRNLRLDPRLSLAETVEQIELVGELPLGLALDASAASKTFRRAEELPAGPWNQCLSSLRATGVEIECHGLALARASENPMGAFLRLTTETGALRTGIDLVSEWLLVLVNEGDEQVRTRAARNLAASGFTPGLAVMEHLVRTRDDRAARAGLLQAAARGRLAPALLAPTVFEPLLAEAEAATGPRSARILCALARGGCFDAQGAALTARLLAGFERITPRARWIRLFLLERIRCAAPEAETLARALLADPRTPAALVHQALLTLAAQDGSVARGAPRVADLSALLRLPLDEDGIERLGRALRHFGLTPPYRDPAETPADWVPSERLALLEAWLWCGELEPVAAHLAAWMQAGAKEPSAEFLAQELLGWCVRGRGQLVDGALRRAQQLAPMRSAALERLRILLGLVPATDVPAVLERGGYALSGMAADLALLGALAGYPVPVAAETAARESLRAHLGAALKENRSLEDCAALIEALQRAAQGLYAAGRDEEGEAFSNGVRQALRRSDKALLGRILEQPWPPAPLSEVRDLGRALARFEVPASL